MYKLGGTGQRSRRAQQRSQPRRSGHAVGARHLSLTQVETCSIYRNVFCLHTNNGLNLVAPGSSMCVFYIQKCLLHTECVLYTEMCSIYISSFERTCYWRAPLSFRTGRNVFYIHIMCSVYITANTATAVYATLTSHTETCIYTYTYIHIRICIYRSHICMCICVYMGVCHLPLTQGGIHDP